MPSNCVVKFLHLEQNGFDSIVVCLVPKFDRVVPAGVASCHPKPERTALEVKNMLYQFLAVLWHAGKILKKASSCCFFSF